MEHRPVFTVGDLRRQLAVFDDADELAFQGDLTFYRAKKRGPELVVLEFNEFLCMLSPEFKRQNPHVKAVFAGDGPPSV